MLLYHHTNQEALSLNPSISYSKL